MESRGMRVSVGSPGRFHTFDLARQMERLGHLCRLNTAYPRWKVSGLPVEKVRTFPWLMSLMMVSGRLGVHHSDALYRITAESFDYWVSCNLEPCEVFHSLSGFGLKSGRLSRDRFGARWVCDRGSSHIQCQDELLATEFDRLGIDYKPIDPWIIERELAEYEG